MLKVEYIQTFIYCGTEWTMELKRQRVVKCFFMRRLVERHAASGADTVYRPSGLPG